MQTIFTINTLENWSYLIVILLRSHRQNVNLHLKLSQDGHRLSKQCIQWKGQKMKEQKKAFSNIFPS